jgi:maleamate amidohydrolase
MVRLFDEETLETYERASFGHTLTRGTRPAVLVVDFSCGFTDPESPVGADMTDAVLATRKLLDAARDQQLLVSYTTVAYAAHLKDAGLTIQKSPAVGELQYGTAWANVDPRLGVRDDEVVIVKKGPSALFGTNMAAIYVSQRVDTVVLCGAVTSGCIRATAIDLFQHGFPTLIPRECVADRAEGPHEANLFDMHAKYADVITLDDALAYVASSRASVPGTVKASR